MKHSKFNVVPCSHCDANVGEPCHDGAGNLQNFTHTPRVDDFHIYTYLKQSA